MKSVREDSYNDDDKQSLRLSQNSINQAYSFNKPHKNANASINDSYVLKSMKQYQVNKDIQESTQDLTQKGQKQYQQTRKIIEDQVMSRTDWFAFLKVAYNQITSQRNTEEMINKSDLVQLIELNIAHIPLQSLENYLGQSSQQRREKWLSYQQVIETITNLQGNDYNFIHWDDIIESLLVVKQPTLQQLSTFTRESTTVSNIFKAEYELESPKTQNNIQDFKKLVNKIVLKDQSVLLDLSKVHDQYTNSQNPGDIMDLIQQICDSQQLNYLRTLSLSQLQIKQLQLRNLSRLNNLVILNLSNVRGCAFLNQELRTINLLNLQFLNICNNNLSEISISNHNFPKLKELYASYNNFQTAKYFNKIDTLKLLDLSFNQIDHYEDILCLAFLEGLVVLNLTSNPLHCKDFQDFENTVRHLLPRIMLLNPQCITKVSCFENFREIAFSIGDINNNYYDSKDDDNENEYQGVSSRKVNIKIAINNNAANNNISNEIASISAQSTPQKSVNEQMQQKVATQQKKDLKGVLSQNKSPYVNNMLQIQQNIENLQTPPFKRQQDSERRLDQTILVHKQIKAELSNITNQYNQREQQLAFEDTSNTYDSQKHQALSQPQQLPVKNDSKRYFYPIANDTNVQNIQFTNNNSHQKSPSSSKTMISNFAKSDRQRPPRSIKIKNTSTSVVYDKSQQKSSENLIYSYGQQNNCNIITSRTQKHDHNANNSSAILPYKDQPFNQSHIKIKREMSANFKETPKSNLEVEISGFNISAVKNRESSIASIGNKRLSYADNEVDDSQSELAQYYEKQLTSMNISTIRGMPSKEVFKIKNPTDINQSTISPIKAMMIQKPPEDQQKTVQKFSNIMINSTTHRSNRNSERKSLEFFAQNNLTPVSYKSKRGASKSINSRNSYMKQQSSSKRTYNKTQSSQDINKMNDSYVYQNKTQNVNVKKIVKESGKKCSVNKDLTFSNTNSSTKIQYDQNNSRNVKHNYSSQNGYNSTQVRNHSYSPSANYGGTQYTGRENSLQPVQRMSQDMKNIIKPPQFIQNNEPTYIVESGQASFIPTSQYQQKNSSSQQFQESKIHQDGGNINTPRFSERCHQKKEAFYKDAIHIIKQKRQKIEKKKQMMYQMTGKCQKSQTHKQSQNSFNNSSIQQKNSSNYDYQQEINNIQSVNYQNEQQNPSTSLKIDLRQRRI